MWCWYWNIFPRHYICVFLSSPLRVFFVFLVLLHSARLQPLLQTSLSLTVSSPYSSSSFFLASNKSTQLVPVFLLPDELTVTHATRAHWQFSACVGKHHHGNWTKGQIISIKMAGPGTWKVECPNRAHDVQINYYAVSRSLTSTINIQTVCVIRYVSVCRIHIPNMWCEFAEHVHTENCNFEAMAHEPTFWRWLYIFRETAPQCIVHHHIPWDGTTMHRAWLTWAPCVFFFRGLLLVSYDLQLYHFVS